MDFAVHFPYPLTRPRLRSQRLEFRMFRNGIHPSKALQHRSTWRHWALVAAATVALGCSGSDKDDDDDDDGNDSGAIDEDTGDDGGDDTADDGGDDTADGGGDDTGDDGGDDDTGSGETWAAIDVEDIASAFLEGRDEERAGMTVGVGDYTGDTLDDVIVGDPYDETDSDRGAQGIVFVTPGPITGDLELYGASVAKSMGYTQGDRI